MDGDELDQLLRAVSHATRRQILRLCAQRPIPAGDVAAQIDLALASVSEHLKVLRKTGLVDVERDGTRWYYLTNTDRLGQALAALHHDVPAPSAKEAEAMTSPIVHFEIAGPHDPSLRDFYRTLFGWDLRQMGPGYTLATTPVGSPDGAIREAEHPELTIGIGVDDLDASLAAAVRSGGTIVMPATDNGYVNKGQVTDPAGNLITLIENTRPE